MTATDDLRRLLPPPITDEQVRDLPLHDGRHALLGELLRAEPATRRTPSAWRTPRRTALVGLAAASVVALIGLGPLFLGDGGSEEPSDRSGSWAGSGTEVYADGDWVVASDPAWEIANVWDAGDERELAYDAPGGVQVEIHQRPAAAHDSYRVDRADVSAPTPLSLLGSPAERFDYGPDDHAVIAEPVGAFFLEVRVSGVDAAGLDAVLDVLQPVSAGELSAYLPDDVVIAADQPAALDALFATVDLPPGLDRSVAVSTAVADLDGATVATTYTLGVAAVDTLVCGWVAEVGTGGDSAAAVTALSSARTAPFAQAMDVEGDYTSVLDETALALGRGDPPAQLAERTGLECP
ncbi:hypothetical protein [Nocardioides zeae]|uniref:Uncharacterized protein n=1 Tax=Nocardioides zeae TaxID=1457234 RepID=A0A6P0HKF7_9ACTN|nr:hypothetical protein [Nocardioides zeae]NEN79091.1 hypothetical protein [Nocardioides zeae]